MYILNIITERMIPCRNKIFPLNNINGFLLNIISLSCIIFVDISVTVFFYNNFCYIQVTLLYYYPSLYTYLLILKVGKVH